MTKLQYITCIVGLLSFFGIIGSFITMANNCKIYDYEPQPIVEQYEKQEKTAASINVTEEKQKKTSFFLLCGAEQFDTIQIDSEITIDLKVKKKAGEFKILAKNQKDGNILSQSLADGKNELLLEQGEYLLYVVGKWFCGSIQIIYP